MERKSILGSGRSKSDSSRRISETSSSSAGQRQRPGSVTGQLSAPPNRLASNQPNAINLHSGEYDKFSKSFSFSESGVVSKVTSVSSSRSNSIKRNSAGTEKPSLSRPTIVEQDVIEVESRNVVSKSHLHSESAVNQLNGLSQPIARDSLSENNRSDRRKSSTHRSSTLETNVITSIAIDDIMTSNYNEYDDRTSKPKIKISLDDSGNSGGHSKQSSFRHPQKDKELRNNLSREDTRLTDTQSLRKNSKNSTEDLKSHSRSKTSNIANILASDVKALDHLAAKTKRPQTNSTEKKMLVRTDNQVSKTYGRKKSTTMLSVDHENEVDDAELHLLPANLVRHAKDGLEEDRSTKKNRKPSLTPPSPTVKVSSSAMPISGDHLAAKTKRPSTEKKMLVRTDNQVSKTYGRKKSTTMLSVDHENEVDDAELHLLPANLVRHAKDGLEEDRSTKKNRQPSLTPPSPTLKVSSSTTSGGTSRSTRLSTLSPQNVPPPPHVSAYDEAAPEVFRPSAMMAVLRAKRLLSRQSKKSGDNNDGKLRVEGAESPISNSSRSSLSSNGNSFIYVQPTDDEIIDRFMKIYPKLESLKRKNLLKEIIGNCDPTDMKQVDFIYRTRMLNETIPRYHRDFLSLCNLNTTYKILEFVSPKDLITASSVSKQWYKILKSQELWYALYESIGLASMAKAFYIQQGSVVQNANLFSSIYNWAHGIFSYRSIQAHFLGVISMSFDGKSVATGSSDMSAKVFNVRTGVLQRTLQGHDGPIHAIQHDAEKVVTGSTDSSIIVWDNRGKGDVLGKFVYHTRPITCLKMKENVLISGSEDKTVRVWDLNNLLGATNRNDRLSNGDILGLSPNPPKIKKAKAVVIRELTADEKCCQRTLHGHESAVKSLDMCGNVIISGDIRGIVILWHISSGNCLNILGFHQDVQHPIQIGIDVVTDMKRENHPPIINEPIAEIQYVNNRLLVSTLSGYAFINDVTPFPEYDPDPLVDYTNFYNWAIDESTFTQKPTFFIKDYTEPPPAPVSTTHNPTKTLAVGNNNLLGSTLFATQQSAFGSTSVVLGAASPALPKAIGLCKWTLCSKSDEWRLLAGGSVGYLNVFNHRIGKFIYKLQPIAVIAPEDDPSTLVRKRSFHELFKKNNSSAKSIANVRPGGGTPTITALDFNDSFIIGCSMDGKVHIWEPKPSVVKSLSG